MGFLAPVAALAGKAAPIVSAGAGLAGALRRPRGQRVDEQSTQAGSFMPVFGDQGQQIINALAGQEPGQAEATFSRLMQGGENPFQARWANAFRQGAFQDFGQAMRGVRGAGFRGGQGRDFMNQGQLASNFSNDLNANIMGALMGQHNVDNQLALGAAGGAGNLELGRQGSLLNLLSLLRGEDRTTGGTASRVGSGGNRDIMGALSGLGELLKEIPQRKG